MGDDESRFICLPGSEVPNWFSHKGIGSSIFFHAPSISKGQFLRLLVCVVCSFYGTTNFTRTLHFESSVIIQNKTRGNRKELVSTRYPARLFDDEDSFIFPRKKGEDNFFLFLTPLIRNKYALESGLIFNELVMEIGDEIQVSFDIWGNGKVKKCGVHLVVDEPNVK